jgi:NRAMP (natural resistance-associated macrophage protein)-like metal ion transporter
VPKKKSASSHRSAPHPDLPGESLPGQPPSQPLPHPVSGPVSFIAIRPLLQLGPGLITGAADDDPSGIATYSQVGAQFGFGMLWTMLFSYPLMAGIQEISARIGRVTGHGLAANIRKHQSKPVLYAVVFLMVFANVFNLGADIGAMGAAATLLAPGPAWLYVTLFGVASLLLQVLIPYKRYVPFLKWLTLALFAYVATALVVGQPRWDALRATFLPHISLDAASLTALVAVLGTTISPYLFFWQASEEVEDMNVHPKEHALKRSPEQAPEQLGRIRFDTYTGMALSNIVAFFIILTAAATLHAHGITNIGTADQAAKALEPLAGHFAFLLFAVGIIGTGLLAIPVLAGSAAYGVSEAFGWKASLERTAGHARRFYATIAAATLLGLLQNFLHMNPIKALFWSAVLNGVVAGPVIASMVILGSNPKVMGKFTLPPYVRVIGWIGAAVMCAATVGMFVSMWH